MWSKACFKPATQLKSNGQKRLLLCDGHDSQISTQFVSFPMDYNFILFLLHSSHLLQPLNVEVFGPMKREIASILSQLYVTEIAYLQKAEWHECHIKARAEGLTSQNILGGW
jgi:DDE superfamily endonuclease